MWKKEKREKVRNEEADKGRGRGRKKEWTVNGKK